MSSEPPLPPDDETSPRLGSLASEPQEAPLADRVVPSAEPVKPPQVEELGVEPRPRDATRRIPRLSLTASSAPETAGGVEEEGESSTRPEFLCVRDLMNKEPKTVRIDKTMASYADLRAWTGVGHALVLDRNGALVGLLSERDFLAVSPSTRVPKLSKAERRLFLDGLPIEQVMRSKIQVIGPHATIQQAAAMMAEHNVGCLPVMDQSRLLGSLDRNAVLAALARLTPIAKPAAGSTSKTSDPSRRARPSGRFSRWAPWLR